MNFFKKKRDNLIEESVETATNKVSEKISPYVILAAAVGLFIFGLSEKKDPTPVIINIYTNKEVM